MNRSEMQTAQVLIAFDKIPRVRHGTPIPLFLISTFLTFQTFPTFRTSFLFANKAAIRGVRDHQIASGSKLAPTGVFPSSAKMT